MRSLRHFFVGVSLLALMDVTAHGQAPIPQSQRSAIAYGDNPAAGAYAEVNGIRLYYETYGAGHPLLILHGNGGSMGDLSEQIRYFGTHYRVIATDSRGHGKSGLGTDHLTYEQMADDLAVLLHQLHVPPVDVLGCSDGGILGLLLAIHHPECVDRLAVMGANTDPLGAQDWALALVKSEGQRVDAKIARGDKTESWALYRQYLNLLGKQPHIPTRDLHRIAAPTLVMASDKDVIRADHTQMIFENIPHAQLCIFPGATHLVEVTDPGLFNFTVDKFFTQPFNRPDTKDVITQLAP